MEELADKEYIRQRIAPKPGDPHYLCLSDLLMALDRLIPPEKSRVLDFGCGGSRRTGVCLEIARTIVRI